MKFVQFWLLLLLKNLSLSYASTRLLEYCTGTSCCCRRCRRCRRHRPSSSSSSTLPSFDRHLVIVLLTRRGTTSQSAVDSDAAKQRSTREYIQKTPQKCKRHFLKRLTKIVNLFDSASSHLDSPCPPSLEIWDLSRLRLVFLLPPTFFCLVFLLSDKRQEHWP